MPSSRAEVSQCSTYNMSRKELFHSTGRASVKETAECRYSWSWSLAADLYYMIPTMYGGRKDHQPTDKSRQFVWSCTTYLLDGFLHPLAYIECNFQFHPPLKALCVAKIKLHTELCKQSFLPLRTGWIHETRRDYKIKYISMNSSCITFFVETGFNK